MKENVRDFTKEITENSEYLRLPTIKNIFIEESSNARIASIPYEEYLSTLLQKETDYRLEMARKRRIKNAAFAELTLLEDLKVAELPKDCQKKLPTLKTLEFIKDGMNVIFAGNSGTGKSHTAVGLGIKACNVGYKVLFTKVPILITQLKENVQQKSLRSFENKFEKYDLIIADEMGYISFDKEGSELLFTCLSLRTNKKSTIITTNLSFDRWVEIFQDPVMTAAMIDRITHKAHIVDMIGPSFRSKEREKRLKKDREV